MIKASNVFIDNINLSGIAFGTHQCHTLEQDKNEMLFDAFFSAGGNVFDTARCYGCGESEKCLGEWINKRGIRDKVILISKGCNHDLSTGVAKSRLNPTDLEKDIFESLSALDTDYIDIYFLHKDDINVSPEVAIDMLNEYVKKGFIKHIGVSNWKVERIEKANEYAKNCNLKPIEYSELAFSLKQNSTYGWGEIDKALEMDKREYEWYKKNKMPVFGYNSQAYGFFYKDEVDISEKEINKRIFALLKRICADKKLTVQQALLGFYFGCDIVNIPIVTTTNISHLEDIIKNANYTLDKNYVKKLLDLRLNEW